MRKDTPHNYLARVPITKMQDSKIRYHSAFVAIKSNGRKDLLYRSV